MAGVHLLLTLISWKRQVFIPLFDMLLCADGLGKGIPEFLINHQFFFFSMFPLQVVKPATIKAPDSLFNLWSIPMGGGLLGYAAFPTASGKESKQKFVSISTLVRFLSIVGPNLASLLSVFAGLEGLDYGDTTAQNDGVVITDT